jgi:hypothetical protein
MEVSLKPSPRKGKKWRVVFTRKKDGVQSHVDFGADGMDDYTLHHDPVRKAKFLSRFRKLIEKHKDNPQAPMTLSRMLLWNKPSLEDSWRDYSKHFHLIQH